MFCIQGKFYLVIIQTTKPSRDREAALCTHNQIVDLAFSQTRNHVAPNTQPCYH